MIRVTACLDLNFGSGLPIALERITKIAQMRAERYAQLIVDNAKQNVLALRDPGRPLPSILADSIHLEQEEPGEIKVIVDAPHAFAVEFGTSVQRAQPYLSVAVLSVIAEAPID